MITKSEPQARLFAEENRAAKLEAENRKLRAELEQARTKAATAEKWQGLALARNGDGRTVQEIQREAAKAECEACADLVRQLQKSIRAIGLKASAMTDALDQAEAAIRARGKPTPCQGHAQQQERDEGQGHNQETRS